jgi:hypothetical protein
MPTTFKCGNEPGTFKVPGSLMVYNKLSLNNPNNVCQGLMTRLEWKF